MSKSQQKQQQTEVKSSEESSKIECRLIDTNLTKCMTKNGKVASYSALVVAGNGAGSVGLGIGRDKSSPDAIAKASLQAVKALESFELYENRTIFHDAKIKYTATLISAWPAPPGKQMQTCHAYKIIGTGRRTNWVIQEICRLAGIKDICGKVVGSRHKWNVAKGFMELLRRQKSPQQIALDSGLKIIDVAKIFNYGKYRSDVIV